MQVKGESARQAHNWAALLQSVTQNIHFFIKRWLCLYIYSNKYGSYGDDLEIDWCLKIPISATKKNITKICMSIKYGQSNV